jgi:hypothetical protein
MSTHVITPPPGLDVSEQEHFVHRVYLLAKTYVREGVIDWDASPRTITFTPNLTAPEGTVLQRLVTLTGILRITPAEWEVLEPDIAGLQTYQNLPSPTLAQTVLAVKAQSRILKAMLRS